MRKRRNWLRTTIAMLTLIATVLETGFTSVSTLAAEITTEDGIVVNTDGVEEAEAVTPDGGQDLDIQIETESASAVETEPEVNEPEEVVEEATATEDTNTESLTMAEDNTEEPVESDNSEDLAMEVESEGIVEEEVFEEAAELLEGTLDVSDDGISGLGYDEISVYVYTDNLANKDKFRIEFTGPSGASYNPVLNNELDKTNGGRYDFEGLEGGDFTVRATSSDDVILSYRYNEDGYPAIYVESEPVEKILETRTLTSANDSEIQAVTGQGYESLRVEFKSDELSDKARFKLVVESNANATVDGRSAIDGITGLDKETGSLTIEGLGEESFTAYVLSDNDDVQIQTIADVDSVEDGVVVFTVDNVDTKRVYEYEDDKVQVTATLERADAIPDDADFVVTAVTPDSNEYNYAAYMEALNQNADVITGEEDTSINETDVLLYDIAFLIDDENGNKVEIQPEEGSVNINISFKRDQLKDELSAEADDEVKIIHLPLTDEVKESVDKTADATNIEASDIKVEVVDSLTSVDAENTEFNLSDFSVTVVYKEYSNGKMEPSNQYTFKDILGEATRYGIVGNNVYYKGHWETTVAAGELHADNNSGWASPRNDGGNAGQSLIGAYNGSTVITFDNNSNDSKHIVYTTPAARYKNPNLPTSPQDKLNEYNNSKLWSNSADKVTFNTTAYSETDIKNKVSTIVTDAKAMSSQLAGVEGYSFAKAYNASKKEFDFAGRGTGEGTYYVNFAEGEYASLPGNDFTIKLAAGQRVVFNIPDSKVILKQYKISLGNFNGSTSADKTEDLICQSVIFNCYNATVAGLQGATSGTFLIGGENSYFSTVWDETRGIPGGPGAGWVIADSVAAGGQEWHCVYHDMPSPSNLSLPLYAKKTVNGQTPNSDQVFEFDLYQWIFGKGAEYIETKTNNGETISFTDQVVSSPGVYSYLIIEKRPTQSGYVIAKPYNVHYKVEWADDTHTELKVDTISVYRAKNDFTEDALTNVNFWKNDNIETVATGASDLSSVVFNNETTNEINDFTYYDFPVEKIVKGSDGTVVPVEKWPADFTFTLTKKAGNAGEGVDPVSVMPFPGNHSENEENPSETITIGPSTGQTKGNFGRIELNAKELFKYSEENRGSWGNSDDAHYQAYRDDAGEYDFIEVRNVCFKYEITETIDNTLGSSENYDIGDWVNVDDNGFAIKESAVRGHKYIKLWVNIGKKTQGNTTEYRFVTVNALPDGAPRLEPHLSWDNDLCYAWHTPVPFTNRYDVPIEKNVTLSGIKKVFATVDNEKTQLNVPDHAFKFGLFYYTTGGAFVSTAAQEKWNSTDDNNRLRATVTFDPMPLKFYADANGGPTGYNTDRTEAYYYYKIKETGYDAAKIDANSYTMDPRVFVAKVTIYKNENNSPKVEYYEYTNENQLSGSNIDEVLAKAVNADAPYAGFDFAFENERTATGEAVIHGSKTLTGREMQVGDVFTFTLSSTDDDQEKANQTYDFTVTQENVETVKTAGFDFAFDALSYDLSDDGKEYHYTVKETAGSAAGVVYDTTEYTVTIRISDQGNGSLKVDQDKGKDKPLEFNNTYSASGDIFFKAHKIYATNSELSKDKEFSFILEGGKEGSTTTSQTETRKGEGPVEFDTIKFNDITAAGTYKYTIREYIPDGAEAYNNDPTKKTLDGVIYDARVYHILVKVSDNASGVLQKAVYAAYDVEPTETADYKVQLDDNENPIIDPGFTNDYFSRETEDAVGGTKILNGRDWKDADRNKFAFKLYYDKNDTLTANAITNGDIVVPGSDGEQTVHNGEHTGERIEEFNFDNITFKKKGTYRFYVEEVKPGDNDKEENMTYSDEKYVVKFNVADNEKGQLNATHKIYKIVEGSEVEVGADSGISISFTNTYNGKGGVILYAQKVVNGSNAPEEGKFGFTLTGYKIDGYQTKYNDAEGKVTFDKIEYTNEDLEGESSKQFTYTVKETKIRIQNEYVDIPADGKIGGYTCDTAEKTITVTVTRKSDGSLETVPDNRTAGFDARFDNTYSAIGSTWIEGTKTLTGRNYTGNDTFTAEIYSGYPANKDNLLDTVAITKDTLSRSKGSFSFGTEKEPKSYLTFTKADDYIFTVKEAVPVGEGVEVKDNVYYLNGVRFDPKSYKVTVTAKDNGDGTLTCVPTIEGGPINFINTFEDDGEAVFAAEKILKVGEKDGDLKGGEFSFTIKSVEGNPKALDVSKSNEAGGAVTFDAIRFTQDDLLDPDHPGEYLESKTFEYTITEDHDSDAIPVEKDGKVLYYEKGNYRYSAEVFTAKAIVSLEGNDLSVVKKYFNSTGSEIDAAQVKFENRYLTTGPVDISAWKVLEGRNITKDNPFTFHLREANGQKIKDAAGNEVTELTASTPVDDGTDIAAGTKVEAKFPTIYYTAEDLDPDNSTPVSDGKFAKYYIITEDIPDGATPIEEGKYYKYNGYTYDARPYIVEVTFKDNGRGEIVADTPRMRRPGEDYKQDTFWTSLWHMIAGNVQEFFTGTNSFDPMALFTNEYAAEGALDLSVKKSVTGIALEKGDFTFLLKEGDDEVGKESNGNKGDLYVAEFGRISYTEAGEHTYTINEVLPAEATEENGYVGADGVHYDPTVYTVIVKVTDPGNGKLDVKAYLTADGDPIATSAEVEDGEKTISLCAPEAFEFKNTYTPTEVSIVPGGYKTLSGRDLEDAEFTFSLVSKEGNPKQYSETTVNKGKEFKFPAITFKPEDMLGENGGYVANRTFAYTLTEVAGSKDGITTYDSTEYDIVVTVSNANGVLTASVTSNNAPAELISGEGGSWYNLATFYNTYSAEDSEDFFVHKLVEGTDDDTKEFTFELTDKKTGEKYRTTCKANATEKIASFTYNVNDLTQKKEDGTKYDVYEYTCEEIKTVDENGDSVNDGYEYSKAVYEAVVTVTDKKDGTLDVDTVITVTGNEEDENVNGSTMYFKNKYSATGKTNIPGSKILTEGLDLEDGEFYFVLEQRDNDGNYTEIDRTTNENGGFGFELNYDQSKISAIPYVYKVRELDPKNDKDATELTEILGDEKFEAYKEKYSGVIFDSDVYDVEVTVSDKKDGTLDVSKTITKDGQPLGACSFTNEVIKPGSASFSAKKTLSDRPLDSGMFTFVLEGDGKDGNDEYQQVENDGSDVNFESIQYNLKDAGKTFHYTIRELGKAELEKLGLPVPAGDITFDDTKYTAEVKVELEKVSAKESKLNVTRKYLDSTGNEVQDITFNNEFKAETKVTFSGSKTLNAPEDAKALVGYTYTFKLTGKDDGEERIVEVTPEKANEPVEFDFGEITYDQTDYVESKERDHKFTYIVEEIIPTNESEKAPNVIYTDNKYEVTVQLHYDAEMNLVADKSDNYNKLAFINTYAAEGDVPFEGIKTITGKDLENGAYTFTLSGQVGNQTVTKTAKNAEGVFAFEPVHFTQNDIGVHTFTITEEAETADGSKYDPSVYTVEVTVFVNDEGKLDYTKKTSKLDGEGNEFTIDSNKIEFNNTYAAYGEHPIKVKKIMHNRPLLQDEFTFILRDEKGNVVEEKNNKAAMYSRENLMAEDEIYFEALKFTQEDLKSPDGKSYLPEIQKYYTVEELHGNKKGYTYDPTVYVVELTIKPTKNLIKQGQYEGDEHVGDYDLEVTEKIVKKNGGTAENTSEGLFARLFKGLAGNSDNATTEIIFENSYEASCLVDPPIFNKQIMGRNIQRGEFEFSIDSKDGLPSMKEFEKSVSKRMVYVPDENGELVKSESDKGYHRVVKNGYTVKGDQTTNPGEISVDDLKFWNTDLWAFDDAEGDLETGVISKKFVYTAVEVSDVKVEGVIPSPAVFVLEFTVTDDGSGELKVSPKPEWKQITPNLLTDEQYSNIFLNLYNMEGSAEIRGIKKMEGRELTKDDIFEFTITDDKTGEVATVNNTPDALGVPSEIIFNGDNVPFLNYKEGVFANDKNELIEIHDVSEDKDVLSKDYTYTIAEKLTNKNGVEYDKSTFKVTVTVTKVASPKDKGYLEAKVTKVDKIVSENNVERFGIADGNHFEFNNKFKATGEMSIDGIKNLVDTEGNKLVSTDSMAGQYEFALYKYDDPTVRARKDAKGLLIDIATTAADGSFSLSEPKGYTEQDLREKDGSFKTGEPKTLLYKIVETKPSTARVNADGRIESDGVVYDDTEYYVDVTVRYNGTNTLDVSRTVTNAKTGEVIAQDIPVPSKVSVGFNNIVKKFTTVEGVKYWNDRENDPSKRPDVHVNLYSRTASGVVRKINTYTIKAPDTTYRFATDSEGNKLATTDSAGRPITYEVEEEPVSGYLSEQNGFDFYNTKGSILIRKIDANTRVPLSGADLAIFDGATEVERWTSSTSAHVIEANLTAGKTYTLRELKAPEGYGTAADMTFTVPADGSGITVTMSDPPIIGSVRLTKRDEATRETLAGAEFALYTDAGARVYATGSAGSYRATDLTSNGIFVTDASGNLVISDLPYGTYYFVETKAPDGYALSAERLGFTILRSGELVEVTFLDVKALGSVRLRKVNEDGTRALAGAVFELYARTPRTIGQAASSTIFSDAYFRYGTYRTNSEGELYVGDLPWDDYYFIEVDAPTGYVTATDVDGSDLVYTFTIDRYSSDRVIDLGGIVNTPERPPITPPPGPSPTPTPTTVVTTSTPTPPAAGVLGARVKRGGVVNGVLGVRAKPSSGVLGVRVGPVTGDASNIILWLLLLTACVATIVATIVTGRKKKTVTK